MYRLSFYVPEDNKEGVKQALFDAGAGRIGLYDHCCFEFKGQGQFRPLKGSDPAIGKQDSLETLEEWKVEMVIEDKLISEIVACLKTAHPYETPAYEVYKIEDL